MNVLPLRRNTSAEVYQQIVENKVLSKRRLQTYDALYWHGPMTANEIVVSINSRGGHVPTNSISPRLAELERAGAIAAVGERVCAVTGYNVIVWDVTSKLPNKKDFKNPKRKFWIVGQLVFRTEKEAAFAAGSQEIIPVIER